MSVAERFFFSRTFRLVGTVRVVASPRVPHEHHLCSPRSHLLTNWVQWIETPCFDKHVSFETCTTDLDSACTFTWGFESYLYRMHPLSGAALIPSTLLLLAKALSTCMSVANKPIWGHESICLIFSKYIFYLLDLQEERCIVSGLSL